MKMLGQMVDSLGDKSLETHLIIYTKAPNILRN